jgi:uncharacterized protein YbbK (DUF523 family)
MIIIEPSICLVSSCLMGLCTRYDAKIKGNQHCISYLAGSTWIPVCPEQLGGLSTPRPKAILSGGNGHDVLAGRAQVITVDGLDVTKNYILGARQVLQLAETQNISTAILKSGSPSCAVNGKIGVTAALLSSHGLHVHEF